MKANKMKKVLRATKKTATYDVDIAQEFRDVKADFKDLKIELSNKLDITNQKLDTWISTVREELSKLNTNMEKVLSQIADHEARIGELERGKLKSDTQKETISNLASFGWWAAKAFIGAGILIGSVLGTAGAWKLVFGA